jgi:3-oxoacyl-ACP reductase-like protein
MTTTQFFETEITSDFDRPKEHYDSCVKELSGEQWRDLCVFKDKNTALFDKRWQSAKAVIDIVACRIGIPPLETGHFLYSLIHGRSPLADKLDDYFDHSGDKAKLKKRIGELEAEVKALGSIIAEGFAKR